jgi:hypothetical protein
MTLEEAEKIPVGTELVWTHLDRAPGRFRDTRYPRRTTVYLVSRTARRVMCFEPSRWYFVAINPSALTVVDGGKVIKIPQE